MPSVDVLIFAAATLTSANGKISVVGIPLTIVLNCIVTGRVADFAEKNKSILVTKTPSGLST